MYKAVKESTKILLQVLSHKSDKGINAPISYYFSSPDMNETMYYISKTKRIM